MHRSVIEPRNVNLIAFESRLRRISPTSVGSLWIDGDPLESMFSSSPLPAARLENSNRSLLSKGSTGKSEISGLTVPDSSLLMFRSASSRCAIVSMASPCCCTVVCYDASVSLLRKIPLSMARVCTGWRKSWLAALRK